MVALKTVPRLGAVQNLTEVGQSLSRHDVRFDNQTIFHVVQLTCQMGISNTLHKNNKKGRETVEASCSNTTLIIRVELTHKIAFILGLFVGVFVLRHQVCAI